uniref:Uncharacterized protein n=1 Tax=Strongyloides papillosus TaxID=174720 RepID=A0A0N5BD86_STREA
MDVIRSSKKDLDGANPLVNYFPKVTAAKRFFQRNIKAILTRMPSRTDRGSNRKKLKDFFSTLLESPPGNSLSQISESNVTKYPRAMLGRILDITISDCMMMLANQTDFNALRNMSQGNEEPIMQFNTRFYQKMIEVYPEYDRRITEEFSGE